MRRNYVDGHQEAEVLKRLLPQDRQTLAAIWIVGKYNDGAPGADDSKACVVGNDARIANPERHTVLRHASIAPHKKPYRRATPMSDDRLIDIETQLAYQEDLVQHLNKVVSDQQGKIDELEKACRKLVDRVVELSEAFAASQVEDAPPPHY